MTVPAAQIQVRALEPDDWPQVADIYAAGIATGNATFETAPPAWEDWDASHRPDLRFVATDRDQVVGWVAASGVSDRCCYAGVIEHSVYVHPAHQGHGIGRTPAHRPHRRRRGSRDLDHPDRHLPREHRQHRPPPRLRLSHCRPT